MNARPSAWVFGVIWVLVLGPAGTRLLAAQPQIVGHGVSRILAHGGDSGDHDDAGGGGGASHFVTWVGHFHPAMTVFPIAMLLAAALAEVVRLAKGPGWLAGASRWCVIVGAIGGVITAPLGWAFAIGHGPSRLLEIHRWLGTAAGCGAVVLLVLSELSHRSPRPGWLAAFRTVLFLAVPLVGATGFFGGAMVYGLHEYDWNPPHEHGDEGGEKGGQKGATTQSGTDRVATVEMTDGDAFKPATITVTAGTTVRWVNRSKHSHTVSNDPQVASEKSDVSMPGGAKPFNSGKVAPGGNFEEKFTVPSYKYICEPHEDMDMKGVVVK